MPALGSAKPGDRPIFPRHTQFVHLVRTPPRPSPIWRPHAGIETGLHLRAAETIVREFDQASHRIIALGAGDSLPLQAPGASIERLAMPIGQAWLAARALRGRLRDLAPGGIVLCWSAQLAGAARQALPPVAHMSRVDLCRQRVITHSADGPSEIAFPLRSVRFGPGAGGGSMCRTELGLEADERVIAMAGDVDITPLNFVTGILREAGLNVRGMVQAGSAGLRRARVHAARGRRMRAPIVLRGAVTLALGACDLLLMAPRGPGQRLAVSQSQAAGVPVVAGPDDGLADLFHGVLRQCVATSWAYSDLARVCRRLLEDEPLRQRCSILASAPSDQVTLGTQLRAAWKLAGITPA